MDDLQRSTIPFNRLLSVLLLAVATTPAEAAEEAQGAGHLRLTGSQNVDAQYTVGCELTPDKGLVFTLTQLGTNPGPQVEVRIGDYHAAGSYQGPMVVRARTGQDQVVESNGTARIEVQARQDTGVRGTTELSGSFEGAYQGAAGQGNATGHIERCTYRNLVQ
jgi:hypothetical protein